MALTNTAKRNLITNEVLTKIQAILDAHEIEYFRTGSNLNTFTFVAGEMNDKEVYGSIKLTLHKEDFDLDAQIEEFEMLMEERERKEKDKADREAKKTKEKAEREAKMAARKAAKDQKNSDAQDTAIAESEEVGEDEVNATEVE